VRSKYAVIMSASHRETADELRVDHGARSVAGGSKGIEGCDRVI
jgi:hypothetical protein